MHNQSVNGCGATGCTETVEPGEDCPAYGNGESHRSATLPSPLDQSYEDYLSDEPGQYGIPDGMTRAEYERYVSDGVTNDRR